MALSWIYKLWVKLTDVKVPLESIVYFFSKNPGSSCLSAKHAIALCMMTGKAIQRNT